MSSMIRIFKFILLLVCSQVVFGQAPSNYTNINGRYRWIAGMFDSTFHIPKGTTTSLRTGGSTNPGALFYRTTDSSVYYYTGTQWLKVAGAAGFVPYTGATQNVDLGQFGLKTKYVEFDTSSQAVTDRRLQWSNAEGTLQFGMTNGSTITQRIGLEQFARVRNLQGDTIEAGDVVYISGASGDRASVKLADNRADSTSSKTLGVAAEQILPNDVGLVGTFGVVGKLNLSAFTAGDVVYLDSIPGKLTKVKPQAPYHMVFVGIVERANAGNGLLFVNVQNGYELEELHNVRITSPVNNRAILAYDSVARLWKDTTLNGIGGVTGSGTANYVTKWTGTNTTGNSIIQDDGTNVSIGSSPSFYKFTVTGMTSKLNSGLALGIDQGGGALTGDVYFAGVNNGIKFRHIGSMGFEANLVARSTISANRAYTLPDSSGTVALLSNVTGAINGTTNYISKFTGTNSIGNSQIFDNGTNVGINDTSPQYRFDVSGDLGVNGYINIGTTPPIKSTSGTDIAIGGSSDVTNIYYELASALLGGGGLGRLALPRALTTTRTYTLQNASGTLAFTSDIPTVSGTTNYIPKFTSSSAIGNSAIVDNSTNITIAKNDGANDIGLNIQQTANFTASFLNLTANNDGGAAYNFIRSSTFGGTNHWQIGGGGTANTMVFLTNSAERMRLDASGNLGLAVTPSAWDATNSIRVFQLNAGNLWNYSTTNLILGQNSYSNTSGQRTYTNNGYASEYEQGSGQHIWKTAPSGTAGNAITFTQAMTLDASGSLLVGGTTNPYSLGRAVFFHDASRTRTYFQRGVNLIEVTPSDGASPNIISSSFTESGSAYMPLSLSARQNNADLYLTTSGNVGIGTTNPGAKLDVAGVFNGTQATFGFTSGRGLLIGTALNGGTNEGTTVLNARGAGAGQFLFQTDGNDRVLINTSGNVGIGTTSPTGKLTVSQNNTGGVAAILLTEDESTIQGPSADTKILMGGNLGLNAASTLIASTNGSERMRITSGGEVYIAGTTDQGAYNLQVNGTGVWGAGAYVDGSDSAVKKNIQPLGSALDLIKQMNPVTFEYKPFYSKDTTTQTGFIAQELQQVLSDKVYKNGIVKEGGQYLGVAYQHLIPLLVKSIQELEAQVQALKLQLNK